MFAARRSIHADRCVIHSAKPAYLDGATRFIDLIYTLAYWYSRGRLLHSCWNEWMVWSPIYVLFTLTDCGSTNRTDESTKILSADMSVLFFAFVEPVHMSADTCWPGQSFPKSAGPTKIFVRLSCEIDKSASVNSPLGIQAVVIDNEWFTR